ncbi:MAG: DUF11 domain-containing protein [Clostridia bacterium]|nr:DUF11 domain-containing protein [Clostridia bacterium]
MNKKNKSALIGGLLAIIVLMATGYAAFSTTLTIGSSANVSSTWNVAFDTTKTSGTSVITPTTGAGGSTAPTGTVSYGNNGQSATVTAALHQPGDKVVFTLTIKNTGTINATLGDATLSNASGCTISSKTCTSANGNIKFTAENPAATSLAASTGTTTIKVTAEFVNKSGGNTYNATESASVTVNVTATQA